MTDSSSSKSIEENALEDNENDDEGVEHLYPIQDMAVGSEDEPADMEDSVPNPGDLVRTEMHGEFQESEEVMGNIDDETNDVFNENSSSQELQNKTYIEDFLFSNNVDECSNSNNEEAKEEGKGTPLCRFPSILKAVEAAEYEIIQVLYQLLYQRSAWDTQEILTQRILEFSGFNFSQSSEEYFNREMMLQTQPNDVLIKLAVLLGLEKVKKSNAEINKARPGIIRSIMAFLFKPCKRTRTRTPSKGTLLAWKELPARSTCGCRHKCFKKVPEKQRKIILGYAKDLCEKGLLDSYLIHMMKATKIVRKPWQKNENIKKLKELNYSYYVKYGGRKVIVCKGAFMSIYNIPISKMNLLQNKIKTGVNLPESIDLEDFPPFPAPQPLKKDSFEEEEEDDDEEEEEELRTTPPKKKLRTDKEYEPSDSEDESEESDVEEIEGTKTVFKMEKLFPQNKVNQNVSPGRSSKCTVKTKEENVQLKDLSLVVKAIDGASKELLIDVHFLLYLNSAKEDKAKDRILEFSGFPFDLDSEEYDERKEFLQRMSFKMVVDVARSFSLAVENTKEGTINNILSFLLKPDESLLRISSAIPISLSDVELDDIEDFSDDSDDSITCEVVEKKVECIDILSSDESDGESKKSKPSSSLVKAGNVTKDPSWSNRLSINVCEKPHNGQRALKDYETIKIFIDSYPYDYLIDIFNLLFMKPILKSLIRHDILEFNGFSFDRLSVAFIKRKQLLDRMLYNSVRRIYNTLIYKPTDGRVLPKPQMVSEILDFLMELPHPDTIKKAQQDKASPKVTKITDKSQLALHPSPSTYSRTPVAPVNPPAIPPMDVSGLKTGVLSDLKRVFQRVACFPCEYLTDVHRLLFMTECESSVIRQNIFAFRGFSFSPDSADFRKRKNYLEYLTFHSLRKISSVLTTKSVDLRNSTKHELVTHLAEVLAEYCDVPSDPVYPKVNYSKIPAQTSQGLLPKGSVPSHHIDTEKSSPLLMDDSIVENIVVTPLIDPSITGVPLSEMSASYINENQNIPKIITVKEGPLKIMETYSVVVPESRCKQSSNSSYPPIIKVPLAEDSIALKLEQCQQMYGTTVSLIPIGHGSPISGLVNSGGLSSQSAHPTIVSTAVSSQIVTSKATNLLNEEIIPSPSNDLQKEKPKQNVSVTTFSDDEDCDKPLSSLVGYPIDSVLEKHVDDIVKSSDLQSITINGVIKKISSMYPKFDLSYRKEFLKSTIRSLLYRLGQEKSDPKRNTDSPDCSVTTTENIDSDSEPLECQAQ